MEKIIQISIHQHTHSLEESAYKALSAYLDSIARAFEHDSDGKEIQQDIELRISEHLKKIDTRPISKTDIERIITLMGTVEELSESDAPKQTNQQKKPLTEKRLFRDSDAAILGGVCAGIATYLDVDPTIVRLIFIALALFGFGIIIPIYLVLWLVLPAPTTVAEKLEMRGEPVTVHSITDTIKQRAEELQQRTTTMAQNPNARTFLARCNTLLQQGGRILKQVIIGGARLLKWALAFILVAGGIGMLVGVASFLGGILSGYYPDGVLTFLAYLNTPFLISIAVVCIALFISIPGILLFFAGIHLVFFPLLRPRVWMILISMWICTLLIVIGLSVYFSIHFAAFQHLIPAPFEHIHIQAIQIQ